jgi:hypothetical protein
MVETTWVAVSVGLQPIDLGSLGLLSKQAVHKSAGDAMHYSTADIGMVERFR